MTSMGDLARTQTDLELMVDSIGLEGVLKTLTAICYDKAEHVRSNWQDDALAKAWEMNAGRISRLRVREIE